MIRIALFSMALMVFALQEGAASEAVMGEVRNSSGKLLYKTTTRGNTTEARSPSGKLLWKSTTKGQKTEVRSPSGKLLQKLDVK